MLDVIESIFWTQVTPTLKSSLLILSEELTAYEDRRYHRTDSAGTSLSHLRTQRFLSLLPDAADSGRRGRPGDDHVHAWMAHIPWAAVCDRRRAAAGWALCAGCACDSGADYREHPGVSPYTVAFRDWAGAGLRGAGVV